jgi:hypothetical protein
MGLIRFRAAFGQKNQKNDAHFLKIKLARAYASFARYCSLRVEYEFSGITTAL